MASAGDPPLPAYHERQRLQRCLQHTLNNLLQMPAASAADLDDLANQLAPGRALQPLFHPHRTVWLGNWDVNVLELALRRHGKELQWHDLRDATFARLDLGACFGLILNIRADGVVTRLLGGRHWVALRCLGGRWWNLDSSLPAPQLVSACCSGGELAVPAGSSGPAVPVPPDVASTAGRKADLAAAEAAEEAADSVAASAAAAEAEADGSGKVATSRGAPASSSPCRAPPTAGAAEGAATPSDVAAADAAAVRMFLMQQVHEKDAKIFCVLDLPLASHPLPDDCSRSSADEIGRAHV